MFILDAYFTGCLSPCHSSISSGFATTLFTHCSHRLYKLELFEYFPHMNENSEETTSWSTTATATNPNNFTGILLANTLQCHHNERGSVSNHQHLHCLLNRLFNQRKIKALCHWPLWHLCLQNVRASTKKTCKNYTKLDIGASYIRYFKIWPQNRILHKKTSAKDPSNVFLVQLECLKTPKETKNAGNSPVSVEFPAQKASNAENFPFDDVIMAVRIAASDPRSTYVEIFDQFCWFSACKLPQRV